ncbi:hypothetical protein FRACYDRAFT_259815 [Fragilariopsis cylindrus CCMP1102]|uniref:Mini-chromosome maintenance complex-binding protein n=1 Tax=Fragilariopsis cylindrus CCMP1102 TaxID=635003 RepID=A0A1E7FSS4_9STRA|nr:hypothetical protein FRACYDRAFT_259815 [Fragilariopsis cylindrus CCMP1102]|eukprot:OEU21135.1 hypothetical protein FRACYDRAFT_259815 [Fragilariopsis cylindrus CCMP1102]
MDAILQTIRQKLSRGENLSINDFNSLEQIHVNNVMTYSNGNNIDNSNDDDDNDDGSINNVIEYLDPAAAAVAVDDKDITTCTHLQPRLVRYVGMVQDMLDPEYYESSDKYGRSTHFVDHCDLLNNNNNNEDNDEDNENDNDNENHKCWAERIPLVVVPIPFASKWLMGSCSDNNKERLRTNINSKSVAVVVSPVSSSNNRAGDRKRGRDDNSNNDDQDSTMKEDNDDGIDEGKNTNSSTTTDHHHQPPNNKKTMTSSTSEDKDNGINNLTTTTTMDWWPAGTCGTSIDQCPVLAKICYDQLLSSLSSKQQQQQKQKQRPLKLNDVVSLVGVLSMNPWEADFSAQSCSTTRVADDGIGICGFEVDSHNEYYVPPPSRLPRLHVLSYKQFDLDDLAKQAIGVANKKKSRNSNNNNNNNNRMDGDDDEIFTTNSNNSRNNDDDNIEQRSCSMEEEEELEIIDGRGGGRGSIERISSLLALDPLSSSLSSTALWTRALYLTLLSDAERQHPQNNPGGDDDVETLPATMVRVGPAERALGCVSLRLSTPDVTSSKALFRQLAEDILPEICPVVAVVDLTTTMMNNNDFSLFPRKDSQGRLKPCPLQLPKGSVVLIHYPLSTYKKNENNQDDAQRETILRDLVQHHRLPYQFEGGVVIPFEADYRIIVVTTQTQELPCTLSVLATTGIGMSSTSSATTTGTETIPSKPELREILMKGRLGNGSTGNDELKKFSSSFLQRAQTDFLERRQRFHQTSSSTLPGEDDFHRWLSLTRLHTKSRRSIDGLSPNGGEAMMVEEIEGPSLSSSSAPLPSEEYWEPTVEDWEAALQLDDAIRDMV